MGFTNRQVEKKDRCTRSFRCDSKIQSEVRSDRIWREWYGGQIVALAGPLMIYKVMVQKKSRSYLELFILMSILIIIFGLRWAFDHLLYKWKIISHKATIRPDLSNWKIKYKYPKLNYSNSPTHKVALLIFRTTLSKNRCFQ